ncbi:MAG: alpha/beta hydrolase [Gammaproteobacteria bacterium]|nr:alpha/beta hydrolase [Gammaproteobacteria bacterium]
MPNAEEITLRSGALTLSARAWGAVDAPCVIALHGWLDNAATFDRLAPLLKAWRIVALDFPGHGHSEHRPPGTPYHFLDFVADTVNAVDALELNRFALVGHSLGANVASFVAATIPERISCLTLLEGFGPFSAEPAAAPAQLSQAISEMRALADKRLPVYTSLEEAARARQQVSDFDFDSAMILSRRGTRECEGGYTWRSDPRLRIKSPYYLSEQQIIGYLRAIEAPALLVRAARGLPVRRPEIENRYQFVPQLQIRNVDGGHHVHLQDAQPVANIVRDFLTQH